VGNCLNRRARRAIAEADYSRAARYYERYRLDCLNRSTFCPNVRGYLVMSASVHSSLARAHLADGRIDKAIEEAHACLAALPADIQVVLDLVPELDKLGHKQDADRLFSKTFELLEAVCREYPRSAHYHNNAAWLAARCNRHLDRALEYGQQAVKLDPDNPAFLDTLAETYFRRGNRERAIQLMKKCITLDPKNSYLQEQLKRFTSENARDDSSRGT